MQCQFLSRYFSEGQVLSAALFKREVALLLPRTYFVLPRAFALLPRAFALLLGGGCLAVGSAATLAAESPRHLVQPHTTFVSRSSTVTPPDRPAEGITEVAFVVRIIRAERLKMGGGKKFWSEPIAVDKRLGDISEKLGQLQYQEFHLIAERALTIPVLKRAPVDLVDGHSLVLRPLYVQGRRAGFWLKWQDGNGATVLETRMHVDCGETVVTGTEASDERGLVIAVQADRTS